MPAKKDTSISRHIFSTCVGLVFAILQPTGSDASPFIGAGDSALRHDVQRLADHGVIKGPTSTWPLAWGPILADINGFSIDENTPVAIVDAIGRLRARASWETRSGELLFNARLAGAEKPKRWRSFEDTPRGNAELSAGFTYTGNWFTASLNGQLLDTVGDAEEVRADRSVIAASVGNWTLGVNTLERWWGPGWDGSLILSNNARPIPAISIDRNFTDAFENKWLSWIGPWDLSVHFGQFESDRFVPDARLFAMRFAFRPIPSLEIGLSRSAQWCGDGRPCDLDTFFNLLIGRDNREDDDITRENEPGNQLAGADVRWTTKVLGRQVAFYGQFIGEDEAGGFPSRYLGQVGVEGTGVFRDRWSYRWFSEAAETSCQFYESPPLFNCAYNNSLYKTGYRYRGPAVGHGSDNDAQVISIGLIALSDEDHEWAATIRVGELNRGGAPDPRNGLTPTQQEIASIDVRHSRSFEIGEISGGIGVEQIDDIASGDSTSDVRFFIQWRNSY